jgi:hypothetical protein
MRRNDPNGAPTWRRCTILLIASLGIAGCFPPPQVGESADPNCGIFYSCGSHSDPNQGGNQTATGTSSDSSSSSSTSTGGEGATAGDGD